MKPVHFIFALFLSFPCFSLALAGRLLVAKSFLEEKILKDKNVTVQIRLFNVGDGQV
jgi:hypothetical protein